MHHPISIKKLSSERWKRHLKIFFARTSKTSHFKSILSPRDASLVLRGRFPFTDSFPLLLTLLSSKTMHNLFEFTWTVPPKFVRGFRRTGEDTVALWKDADPSSTGCSTVPLTYLFKTDVLASVMLLPNQLYKKQYHPSFHFKIH